MAASYARTPDRSIACLGRLSCDVKLFLAPPVPCTHMTVLHSTSPDPHPSEHRNTHANVSHRYFSLFHNRFHPSPSHLRPGVPSFVPLSPDGHAETRHHTLSVFRSSLSFFCMCAYSLSYLLNDSQGLAPFFSPCKMIPHRALHHPPRPPIQFLHHPRLPYFINSHHVSSRSNTWSFGALFELYPIVVTPFPWHFIPPSHCRDYRT